MKNQNTKQHRPEDGNKGARLFIVALVERIVSGVSSKDVESKMQRRLTPCTVAAELSTQREKYHHRKIDLQ